MYYRFLNKITLEYYDVSTDVAATPAMALFLLRDCGDDRYDASAQWRYEGIITH